MRARHDVERVGRPYHTYICISICGRAHFSRVLKDMTGDVLRPLLRPRELFTGSQDYRDVDCEWYVTPVIAPYADIKDMMHSTVHMQMQFGNIRLQHKHACWHSSIGMTACCNWALRGAVSGISLLAYVTSRLTGQAWLVAQTEGLEGLFRKVNVQTCYLG